MSENPAILLVGLLLVPLVASAHASAGQDPFAGLIPEGDVGPVGIVNELYEAHSTVTDLMITYQETIIREGFVDDDLSLEAVYVDEENEVLVVWLNPVYLFDKPLDADDIREALDVDVPLDIKYGFFIHESTGSECPSGASPLVCYYWQRYLSECVPSATRSHCSQFGDLLTGWGYPPPTSSGPEPPADTDGDGINDDVDQCDTQRETYNGYQDSDGCPDTLPVIPAPTTPTAPTPVEGVLFQDGFENGLGKWLEAGQLEWHYGQLDESEVIPGYTSNNVVAEADDCDDQACILYMKDHLDLSAYGGATLEFDRFVDDGLDRGEYLAVEVGNGGMYDEAFRWTDGSGDDDVWHHETVDLSGYLDSGFNVRFVTEQSSSTEDVAIDNVRISVEDVEDCVLVVRAELLDDGTIHAEWNDCGESIRRYMVYASEDGGFRSYKGSVYGGTSYTFEDPREGKSYEVLVRAQYTGARDYGYTEYFGSNPVLVPVPDRTPPSIFLPNDITMDATHDYGSRVQYSASAFDDVDSVVSVECNPPSNSIFGEGTTVVTCTASDSAGNTASLSFTVTINPYVQPNPLVCEEDETLVNNYCRPDSLMIEIRAGTKHRDFYDFIEEGEPTSATDTPFRGTIGFVGTNSAGDLGFVGAGHTFSPIDAFGSKIYIQSHNHVYDWSTTDVFGYRKNVPITVSTYNPVSPYAIGGSDNPNVDAAWVKLDTEIAYTENRIHRDDGTTWSIVQGSGDDLQRNQAVDLSGYETNSGGHILYVNATVHVSDPFGMPRIIPNHYVANYTSMRGDSGAPVTIAEGDRKLIGIHTGKLCKFDYEEEGTITNIDVWSIFNGTDPSGNVVTGQQVCGAIAKDMQYFDSSISPQSWYYSVVVPWDIIKEEFDIN